MIVNSSLSNGLLWKMRRINTSADLVAHPQKMLEEYEAMRLSTEKSICQAVCNSHLCSTTAKAFWNCSQTKHTRFFPKHCFLTPLNTISSRVPAVLQPDTGLYCQTTASLRLQHVPSSIQFQKPQTTAYITSNQEWKLDPSNNLHPYNNLHQIHSTMKLNTYNWEIGTVGKSSKAPFSKLILRLQSW